MNLMRLPILLALLFALGLYRSDAQEAACLDFQQLPVGLTIRPDSLVQTGDTLFVQPPFFLQATPFFYGPEDPNTGNWQIEVMDQNRWPDAGLDGTFLFISNVNLTVGQMPVVDTAFGFCFDFADGGGSLNLQVNGDAVHIFEDFREIDGKEVAPGVKAWVEYAADGGFPRGRVCLRGPVFSLTLGGQELGVDNVCVQEQVDISCEGASLKVTEVRCDSDSLFYLWLRTDLIPVDAKGYSLSVNNQVFGPFFSPDSLLKVGPVLTYGDRAFEIVLFGNSTDCKVRTVLENVDCREASCSITEVRAEVAYCTATGPRLRLDAQVQGVEAGKFKLALDGQFVGYFDLERLPLDIPWPFDYAPAAAVRYELCVEGTNGASCCAEGVAQVAPCPPDDACITFSGLEQERYGDGIHPPGEMIFAENGIPVIIGSLQVGNQQTYGVTTVAKADTSDFPPLMTGKYLKLNNNTLLFAFDEVGQRAKKVCVDFVDFGGAENIAVNGGPVVQLNSFREVVLLDSLYPDIRFELIPAPGSTPNFFAGTLCLEGDIRRLGIGGQELYLDNLCYVAQPLTPCPVEGLKVDVLACREQLFYDLLIKPDFADNSGAGALYQVWVDGQVVDVFPASAFPLRLSDVPVYTEALHFQVKVCPILSTGIANCCVETQVRKPPCSPQEDQCLGFDGQDTIRYVREAGFFPGDEIFVEGPVPVRIAELQHYDWSNGFGYLAVYPAEELPAFLRASGRILALRNISAVFDLRRVEGEIASVSLDFYHREGTLNLAANGGAIQLLPGFAPGRFEVAPGLVAFVEFFDNAGRNGTITFTGNLQTLLIGGQALALDNLCIELKRPCKIWEMAVKPTSCDETGKFHVLLDFRYEDVSDFFTLIREGDIASRHRYSELPLKLGPYQSPTQAPLLFEVFDDGDPECRSRAVLEPYRCEAPECSIRDLTVAELSCNENGTYDLRLKLIAEGAGEVLAYKTLSGAEGRFRWQDQPVLIQGLPLRNEPFDLIKVYDPNQPDCVAELEYRLLCPPPVCPLGEIKAAATDCKEDGTYFIEINAEYRPYAKDFTVYLNDRRYDAFRYAELPLRIGPFNRTPNDAGEVVVTLKDNQYDDCGGRVQINVPDCHNTGCAFEWVKAEVADCADGQFFARLQFRAGKGSDAGFLVFAEGQLFGPFAYDEQEVILGPFAADGVTTYDFLLVDQADPTCFGYVEMGPVACNTDCRIEDLRIEGLSCIPDSSGFYPVFIDFRVENAGNDRFDLIGPDGQILGTFPLADLPLTVEIPVTPGGGIPDQLIVCINDNPDCCARAQVAIPDCPPPCEGIDFEVAQTACDSSGAFFLEFDFDLMLTVIYPVTIEINGQFYDSLEIANPQDVRIGPFRVNADQEWTVRVIDGFRPECSRTRRVAVRACVEDEVWPGDANRDRLVNHLDLLHVGVAYGSAGPERAAGTEQNWVGIPASAWAENFAGGLNYKHADCNGDGFVDAEDIRIIERNYGLTSGERLSFDTLPATDLDPEIFFELPDADTLPDNQFFQIPIVLGTPEKPVDDIYGLAFTLHFDPSVIEAGRVDILYPAGWLGQKGVNLESVDYLYAAEGRIEVAITRTDQNEVSGFGPVAFFRGIKDDIAGFVNTRVELTHSHAFRKDLGVQPLNQGAAQITFQPGYEIGMIDLRRSLRIFPNPATDWVEVRSTYNLPIEYLQLIGTDGKVAGPVIRGSDRFSVANLPRGLYILKIAIGEHILHEKLFVK